MEVVDRDYTLGTGPPSYYYLLELGPEPGPRRPVEQTVAGTDVGTDLGGLGVTVTRLTTVTTDGQGGVRVRVSPGSDSRYRVGVNGAWDHRPKPLQGTDERTALVVDYRQDGTRAVGPLDPTTADEGFGPFQLNSLNCYYPCRRSRRRDEVGFRLLYGESDVPTEALTRLDPCA